MRLVLPVLVLVCSGWIALTFEHPTLARGAYEVLTSKDGLRVFAFCLAVSILFTFLRRRK